MPRINITETVLRDGHQSMIATRMRTEDMLPICAKLDQVGFWSLEVWGGATFDACLRFLKEDPWERLRVLRKALPNTRLQMLLRGQNLLGYRHYSDDVVRAFVQKAATNGIDVFRIFDALNDLRNLRVAIEEVKKAGKHAQGAISYTTSPVHTNAQFVQMARELEAMGCDTIVVKDMAGLLLPGPAAELFAALRGAVAVPLQLHSHATTGVAPISHWKAVENGATQIDTCISAFANGASHPATETMVAAFQNTAFDSGLDLGALQEIGMYFSEVRKKYHQFEGGYNGVDTRILTSQIPGGMISNLAHQLREQGALNRMNDVMAEIPRVREDLGFPPLVTPTSQIVGSQAVLNVLTGERYKNITNEVKFYLQGRYGRAPGSVNSVVRQKAIGDVEVIECRPADLLPAELENLREEIAELALSDEDTLTYAMFPEIGRQFLEQRAAGTLRPELLEPVPTGEGKKACTAPTEFQVVVHGETYHVKFTGAGHHQQSPRPFYMTLDGVPEEIMVEVLDEVVVSGEGGVKLGGKAAAGGRPRASKPGHVTTSMPGTIVDVLVRVGDAVKAGDPVLITEAMKMESEVQAPVSGKVIAVHVAKGERCNPDEALIEIE